METVLFTPIFACFCLRRRGKKKVNGLENIGLTRVAGPDNIIHGCRNNALIMVGLLHSSSEVPS